MLHTKKKLLCIIILGLIKSISFSQSVGIGTANPNASAQLDVTSTSKGVLLPRMTTAQRKAIINPAPGLMVYDIDKKTMLMYGGSTWGQLVFKESEISPSQTREIDDGAADDKFGNAVSISGDYAVAGAYMDNVAGKIDQGSVIVFHRINGEWVQEAQLFADDGATSDHFGYSVSISGYYIVVGAPDDDNGAAVDQGAVYVFARNGTNWAQQHKFLASGGAIEDRFGYSVSMTTGQFIVGCPGDDIAAKSNQGSATIYLLTGKTWAQEILLTATDGASNHSFGSSVAITGGGAIVGAIGVTNPAGGSGAAYIYIKAVNWGFIQKLLPSVTSSSENYGNTVAIDANTASVGQVYSNFTVNYGKVYVYTRGAFGIWSEQAYLTDPALVDFNVFGNSISISSDQLVIGASNFTGFGTYAAHVSIYKRIGTVWKHQATLDNENSATNGNFGNAVSISGFNVIIGAPLKNSKGEVSFINIE